MTRSETKSSSPRKPLAVSKPAFSQSELHRHSLRSFFELSKELDYSLNVYDFADQALLNFMGQLGTSRSALWLRPFDRSDGLVVVRSHGIAEDGTQSIGAGIGALVARFPRDRQIVLAPDFEGLLDYRTGAALRRCGIVLLAPLQAPDELMGVVALGHRIGDVPYERFELEVLQASMEFFSVALQNTMFSQRMQETNRQLSRANEGLEALDRAKTEFVSTMQHELRTPVTVMQMYLEAVLEEVPAESREHEYLKIVTAQTQKLKRMIEALLDFSRLSNNNFELKAEPGDIAAALREYYDERRNGVALQLHDLRLALEPDLPNASFEANRLAQILDIVLENAVRFSPQGTPITLRSFRRDDERGTWVLIEIEDNGPGIPAGKLTNMFVPFQQLDGSMTREHAGLGLGLALANRLARAMGGGLTASSEVGKGTTITLALRVA